MRQSPGWDGTSFQMTAALQAWRQQNDLVSAEAYLAETPLELQQTWGIPPPV